MNIIAVCCIHVSLVLSIFVCAYTVHSVLCVFLNVLIYDTCILLIAMCLVVFTRQCPYSFGHVFCI